MYVSAERFGLGTKVLSWQIAESTLTFFPLRSLCFIERTVINSMKARTFLTANLIWHVRSECTTMFCCFGFFLVKTCRVSAQIRGFLFLLISVYAMNGPPDR